MHFVRWPFVQACAFWNFLASSCSFNCKIQILSPREPTPLHIKRDSCCLNSVHTLHVVSLQLLNPEFWLAGMCTDTLARHMIWEFVTLAVAAGLSLITSGPYRRRYVLIQNRHKPLLHTTDHFSDDQIWQENRALELFKKYRINQIPSLIFFANKLQSFEKSSRENATDAGIQVWCGKCPHAP